MTERFLEFASTIVKIGKKLNKSFEGRHVYGQLFRAGTSSGANKENQELIKIIAKSVSTMKKK